MNEIDWSQAPEWANARIRNRGTPQLMAWAESYTEDVIFLRDDRVGTVCPRLAVGCWELVAARPTTPSWSGEGLPPVGVVCEAKWGRSGWSRCVVFAHKPNANSGVDVLVDVDGDWTFFDKPSMFRPIRTPEQIAADEREAAIMEMTHVIYMKRCGLDCTPCSPADEVKVAASALYDAGYRKP